MYLDRNGKRIENMEEFFKIASMEEITGIECYEDFFKTESNLENYQKRIHDIAFIFETSAWKKEVLEKMGRTEEEFLMLIRRKDNLKITTEFISYIQFIMRGGKL